MRSTHIFAVDDGYALMKAVSWRADGSIQEVVIPAAAIRGRVTSDADDRSVGAYRVGTDSTGAPIEFTVASRGIGGGIEPTKIPNYPQSDLNRALVHHTLVQAGAGGRQIVLGTALPMRTFFEAGAQDLKKTSLAREVTSLGGQPTAQLAHQHVYAQAFCAWVDHVIDESGAAIFDTQGDGSTIDRREHTIGVVDVGGRTTDFAVVWVNDGAPQLSRAQSSSIDLGMLDVMVALKALLQARFGLQDLNEVQLESALRTGRLKIWGQHQDVQAEIATAATETARRLVTEVQRTLGSGANLDRLLFVGGGSVVLRESLEREYPHVFVADNPSFANARGMLKYMTFVDPVSQEQAAALSGSAGPGAEGVVSIAQRRGSNGG